jgi:excisionase family DNA binding protein
MGKDREDVPRVSPWMAPGEAAAYLQIALGTLRNWTSARYVPHVKKGRVVRYHRDVIDRWLSQGGCSGRQTLADLGHSRATPNEKEIG